MKETKNDVANNVLSGKNNERLDNKDSQNAQLTAAWADIDHEEGEGKVPVPSLECTDEAKDWVDNGSQL